MSLHNYDPRASYVRNSRRAEWLEIAGTSDFRSAASPPVPVLAPPLLSSLSLSLLSPFNA